LVGHQQKADVIDDQAQALLTLCVGPTKSIGLEPSDAWRQQQRSSRPAIGPALPDRFGAFQIVVLVEQLVAAFQFARLGYSYL
jgi:hypothetical protein